METQKTDKQVLSEARAAMGKDTCPNCGKEVARLTNFGLAHHKCVRYNMPYEMDMFNRALRNAGLAWGYARDPHDPSALRWMRYATDAEIEELNNK